MKFAGIIFDLDGTLADTLPVCFAAFRYALESASGRPFTDQEIMARFGPSEEGMIQRLVPDRWEVCLRTYLEVYEREHLRTARLFPGIETALRMLNAREVTLAIVTGKGPQSAGISVRQLGLAGHFDVVETGSPEGGVKPASIQKVLTRWGAAPGRVGYVGDAASDMEAASTVGVIPLGAAWDPRSSRDSLLAQRPLAIFPTVESFIHWIDATVEFTGAARREEARSTSRGGGPHGKDFDG